MADRAKVEYAKRALRRKYTGSNLTSGPLEVEKVYRISFFYTGDDFTNVGAGCNAAGVIFKATGTTPTTWSNGSILNALDVETLKADADAQFEAATKPLTLTSGAFEGGSQSGEITFPKDAKGQAMEELIEEWDPEWTPAPRLADGSVIQLSP